MIVKCPDDWVSSLVHPSPSLRVGLGQHPVHVQDLDTGVHTAGGTELTVSTECSTAAVPLVTGHVGSLVGCGLRSAAGHLCLVLQVQPRPELLLRLVEVPVAGLGLLVHAESHDVAEPVRGGAGRVGVDHVSQGDRHLLVAVVEQLGDDQSVEKVPGVDEVSRPGAQQTASVPVHHVPPASAVLGQEGLCLGIFT